MTKSEAKAAYDQAMQEYSDLVDELASHQSAKIADKMEMAEERRKKLEEAEKIRKDYHLDITKDDAKAIARQADRDWEAMEQMYNQLTPQQKAQADEQRAKIKKQIDDYKSYHEI